MGNDWTPGYASSSTSPSSTRPSSPEIAQNTSNEGTHLGTGSALSTRLDEKIVMKVQMNCQRCRTKAMEIAAYTHGVISVALEGDNRDKVVVTGENIDPVDLAKDMRKKVGHTSILSVE